MHAPRPPIPLGAVGTPPGQAAPNALRRCRQAQLLLLASAVLIAGMAVIGNSTQSPALMGFIDGGATMRLNTAILILAAGVALELERLTVPSLRTVARLLARAIVVLAALTLAQDLLGFDIGIDQLIAADAGRDAVARPGRMSPISALCLILTGGALLRDGLARQSLGLASLTLAAVPLLGYIYSASALFGIEPFASMSINAALSIALLSMAVVASDPYTGITALLVDGGAGGRITRQLLPPVVFGPACIGGAQLAGHAAGLYGAEFGVSVTVLGSSIFLIGLVWMNAKALRTAEARRDDDQRFRALLESAPDGMVIVDSRGHVVLVNSQTERLFGYPREEVLGQPVEMLMPARFRTRHANYRDGFVEQPRRREMGSGQSLYGLRKDGSEFPVEISLSPLNTHQGTVVSATIRDVTDRRAIERALQEQNIALDNANRAKDRFLASMSHELRTPLNAVLGFTGTLLMRLPGPLTGEQEEQLQLVQASGRHLLSLISDLLDLAKIESGKVEVRLVPIKCREVIDEVSSTLAPLAVAKGLGFNVESPEASLVIETDRRALSQILINLVGNAIKFTDSGHVLLRLVPRPDAKLVDFVVEDTGIGIRPADGARLFEAFARIHTGDRPQEGTGLGLHISQKLTALLGGSLSFTSTWGTGSTFTLSLPMR